MRGKTTAQILQWNLSLGDAVLTKSVTPQRITDNLDSLGFELTADDYHQLATLNTGERTGPNPDIYGT